MDPNVCVAELVGLASLMLTKLDEEMLIEDDDVDDLASMVVNLDKWITKGGFLPTRWDVKRNA